MYVPIIVITGKCTKCNEEYWFDGLSCCLLNMGKFCVSYEVLRGMMHQFLIGRYVSILKMACIINKIILGQQYIRSTVSL